VSDTHLTHVELRGAPPADAELVAACAFSPDMVEGRVGNLVHEEAGPSPEASSRCTIGPNTTFSRPLRDCRPPTVSGSALSPNCSARAAGGSRTAARSTNARILGSPRRGRPARRSSATDRTERVTLASRAVLDRRETRETVDDAKDAISDGPDRQRRIEELSRIATAYPDADDLREAAEGRGPTVPDDVPRRSVVAGDLRALDLLTAESGARIAAPEFDPFYSTSGGYGGTWFRDEAETSLALLGASDELGLDADEELLATASFFCRTQDADGSWPHRVWADSGKVAPGWANARIEGANATAGPNDQLDQPASVVAFLARLRRTTDLP